VLELEDHVEPAARGVGEQSRLLDGHPGRLTDDHEGSVATGQHL
jgi:hypothetical protein